MNRQYELRMAEMRVAHWSYFLNNPKSAEAEIKRNDLGMGKAEFAEFVVEKLDEARAKLHEMR